MEESLKNLIKRCADSAIQFGKATCGLLAILRAKLSELNMRTIDTFLKR